MREAVLVIAPWTWSLRLKMHEAVLPETAAAPRPTTHVAFEYRSPVSFVPVFL